MRRFRRYIDQTVMSPITIPVLSSTDMVVEAAVLGLVCFALWSWALPRLCWYCLSILRPSQMGTAADGRTGVESGLLALTISAPAAYYVLWLLTTPPTVISAAGVTGGAGPPYYRPTSIRWSDVTSIRCSDIFWMRPRPRFGLSVESGSAEIWIGRMSRFRAEELLEAMQAHAPAGAVHGCPAWSEFPFRSTR